MERIDLGGTWRLGWSDGRRGIAATPELDPEDTARFADAEVPGEVHLDLMRAGMLGEPSLGMASFAQRWVEESVWWYHREFAVPPDGKRTWLTLAHLDLDAVVYVNGVEVGAHCNAFLPYRVEITDALVEGVNRLAVRIDSGAGQSPEEAFQTRYDSPDRNRRTRLWLRRPSYQWSWDWTTRFLTVGLSGEVALERTEAAIVVRQIVPVVEVAPDLTRATVRIRAVLEGVEQTASPATITARVAGLSTRADVLVSPGEDAYEVALEVPDPELWWPNGHGPQALHDLEVEVTAEGLEHRTSKRIGFRRVEVDQSPHPVAGRYFVLRINNRPIFCKGANTAPLDLIPFRVDRERYERLIALAVEAHLVFLRINGAGIYESDDFYDLCDEHGLLVMQDFTLTCGMYPGHDREFLDTLYAEATHQVRRLASHPSLVFWCGSNEIVWSFQGDGRSASDMIDLHIFYENFPRILAREDPSRFYLPSSPFSPMGIDHNHPHHGNQHSWQWDDDSFDFRGYRSMDHRFSTEAGILGPASLPTMRESVRDESPGVLLRPEWILHDNTYGLGTPGRPSIPDRMMRSVLGLDPFAMGLEEYAYWGGLVQAEGLREYVDNFRRRMFDSAAACFWDLNDCWPTTRGWTIVDYYLRRTPGFWGVKRAMAPVSVVVALDGDGVNIYGVNDTADEVVGELTCGFFRTDGPGSSAVTTVTLAANASTLLRTLGSWEGDPAESIAFASLARPGHPVARGRLIRPALSDLRWAPAAPTVRLDDDEAVFESDVFVLGVCIDLDGETALADNLFDIWPGVPYRIPWHAAEAPAILHTGNLASRRRQGKER
jgi:beta-mannosidase